MDWIVDWIVDWIAGLDCWTGLMDWITRLNLFMSHDLHPIKCCKFGYSKHTSFPTAQECTMHKLYMNGCAS